MDIYHWINKELNFLFPSFLIPSQSFCSFFFFVCVYFCVCVFLRFSPDSEICCAAWWEETACLALPSLKKTGKEKGPDWISQMTPQTWEVSQGPEQHLLWPDCQPKASIRDWPVALDPENINKRFISPTFTTPLFSPHCCPLFWQRQGKWP